MKRLLLSLCACLLVYTGFGQKLAGYGAHDQFTDSVSSTSGKVGVYWFENDSLDTPDPALSREHGSGQMRATCDSCGYNGEDGYENLIGVNFGDSNGDQAGGEPNYIDLSGNANMELTIQNTTDSILVLTIALEDTSGTQAQIEPDVSDVDENTGWSENRKGKPGVVLLPGNERTITYTMENSEGENVGGLSVDTTVAGDPDPGYPCTTPADCPVTDYWLNPSAIGQVVFFFNGGAKIEGNQGGGAIWDPTVPAAVGDSANFSIATQNDEIVIYEAPGNKRLKGDILFKEFKIGQGNVLDTVLTPSSWGPVVKEGSDSTIHVEWTNDAANADSLAILYRKENSGNPFDTTWKMPGAGKHTIADSLNTDTTYEFKIRASYYTDTDMKYHYNETGLKTATAGKETAIYSNFNAPNLTVYPNPATDVVNIEGVHGDISLELANQVGKEVASGSGKQLGVSGLKPGVYFLTVKKSGEIVDRRKVLIQ